MQLALFVAVLLLDQISKFLIHFNFYLYESVSIIPRVLNFTYIRNEGIAFGINFPGSKIFFIIIPIVITYYLYRLLKDKDFQDYHSQLGLTLIISGAIGNIIDRIFRGYVVDFIDFYWGNYHWYVFNIADSSVTVGMILLLLSNFFNKK
jgi:signal peptidase II